MHPADSNSFSSHLTDPNGRAHHSIRTILDHLSSRSAQHPRTTVRGNLELETQRKLDAEREKLKEQSAKQEFERAAQRQGELEQKLKDDLARVMGEVGGLITAALPDDTTTFGQVNGIWVCAVTHVLPLVHTLRWSLIELSRAKAAGEGMEDNVHVISH